MLVKKEVKPVRVILACDECGTEMKLVSMIYPYSYTCPKCAHHIGNEHCIYPRIEYEEEA